ncbi:MAG: glucose-6-phosphate isomerase [Archangium sp.]|nr:glucose-6-phosphate isomerase [Archangium sp.]
MSANWKRYQELLCVVDGVTLDVSKLKTPSGWPASEASRFERAFDAMDALEKGAVANPDEQRRVGHYWLRAPELAPTEERAAITDTLSRVKAFSADVHMGRVVGSTGSKFSRALIIGIGGSALGPQLATDALGSTSDKMSLSFFDNTDPDGMDRVLAQLSGALKETLVVVISKSGGTKETRNGMLEAKAAFERAGFDFAKHAVAVTGAGSELDKAAAGWLARFPMWDWVGGRTSQLSAVGLLPAALQGLDVDGLLAGARAMDAATRVRDVQKNPAALLALAWHHASSGRGAKDLVVLPYKDRLLLLSRYLQQLVMESLGKEKDLDGKVVEQGLSVYGNKGSTDQHAYVQQLRDGVANHFVLFVEVLKDRPSAGIEVEPGVTSGDYLLGFLLGTRAALAEKGRESITLTVPDVSARTLGALIALFERTVGFYATLININAYHQPGVEAGKKAAESVLALQKKVVSALDATPRGVEQIAEAISAEPETVFQILRHLSANGRATHAAGKYAR